MPAAQHFLKNRLWILDTARGALILLMTLGHTIHFLYQGDHPLMDIITTAGGMLCFVGFLFISGSTAGLAYLPSRHRHTDVIGRILKRLTIYLLGYYLIAIYIELVRHSWHMDQIPYLKIITFNHLVPFTEFIIAFILLGLLKIPLRPVFQITSKSFLLTLLFSTLTSSLGWYLYSSPTQLIPNGWQALLYGHPDYYSFPILQYFPVYLLGMYWSRTHAYQATGNLFRATLLNLTAISILIGNYVVLFANPGWMIDRWPPQPVFISLGLIGIGLILWFMFITDNFTRFPWTRNTLLLFGQNAFGIFFTHTLILYALNDINYTGSEKVFFTMTLWGISVMASIYLAKVLPLNYSLSLTFFKLCDCELHQCDHVQEHDLILKLKQLFLNTFNLNHIFSVTIANRTYPLLRKRTLLLTVGFILLSVSPLDISDWQFSPQELQNQVQSLQGTVSKQWILTTQPQSITYAINIPPEITPLKATYLLNGKPQGELQFKAGVWQTHIASDTFNPGNFKITTRLQYESGEYATQPTNFYVSAPVFVAWTIDWEGYDSPDSYLQAINDIANTYNIPVTQLFNPRIYTTDTISPERAKFLTDWVINRRDQYGDEIGLHLHMYPDWTDDAGVPSKNESVWGGGWTPGYDVLTSAYTYDEMSRMLKRSKYWFELNNLGEPTSYRAGGWFANIDTLKALSDNGFLVDSSGRTSYHFGTNHIQGHWFLAETAQPYHPSIHDQNNDLPAPRLKILEIPNNGADDYAFSAQQMIDRFDVNFGGDFLAQPRQITYLTHPNWFTAQRQANMKQVFEHINQWNQAQDRGPVIFATLNQIHQHWTKQQ